MSTSQIPNSEICCFWKPMETDPRPHGHMAIWHPACPKSVLLTTRSTDSCAFAARRTSIGICNDQSCQFDSFARALRGSTSVVALHGVTRYLNIERQSAERRQPS